MSVKEELQTIVEQKGIGRYGRHVFMCTGPLCCSRDEQGLLHLGAAQETARRRQAWKRSKDPCTAARSAACPSAARFGPTTSSCIRKGPGTTT